MKAQEIINKLTQEDLTTIGEDILHYIPSVAKYKAKRFISGLCGELKNWDYDETINYGDMKKVLKVIQVIYSKCPEVMIPEPEPKVETETIPESSTPFNFSCKK